MVLYHAAMSSPRFAPLLAITAFVIMATVPRMTSSIPVTPSHEDVSSRHDINQPIYSVPCNYRDQICECLPDKPVCQFLLTIESSSTFTSYTFTEPEGKLGKGRLYFINGTGDLDVVQSNIDGMPCGPFDKHCTRPITADSLTYRSVLAVNGQVPGPTLIVYSNQTMIVDVRNSLDSDSTSIHWHGLFQNNTPWMDGVGGLSHCPIVPGSTFRYIFKAYPTGTYWYHSHTGSQRSDGLFGGLIIREHTTADYPLQFTDSPELHTVILMDWYREESTDIFNKIKSTVGFFPDTLFGAVPSNSNFLYKVTQGPDNATIGHVPYSSGLINGLGRHRDVPYEHSHLKVFIISRGQTYRFRLIGAQSLFSYMFSIDGHQLTVIATDGSLVQPRITDFIIVHAGERYDFLLTANATGQTSFWIRAETLEISKDGLSSAPFQFLSNAAEAILHYSGMPVPKPPDYSTIISIPKSCNATDHCITLNCPFRNFHESYYTNCIHVSDLRLASPVTDDILLSQSLSEGQYYFFNFDTASAVNGRANVYPPFPLQTQNKDKYNTVNICNSHDRCENECVCSHIVEIPYKKTIRFVLSAVGSKSQFSHPIHLHGHKFRIVSTGYGEYSAMTGFLTGSSSDILCNNISSSGNINNITCTYDLKWRSGPPDVSIDKFTILKDTVVVPMGGYVVVQFLSDNPGNWLMHCHVDPHLLNGMAVIINEAPEHQNPAPKGLSTCGNFLWNVEDFDAKLLFRPAGVVGLVGK